MDEHSGVIEDRPHPSNLGMTGVKAVSSGSYHFLWLSLLLFPLLAIAFLLPLTPQDYWWYLPLGKTILASGSVPSVDTFSFSSAGQPIYYQAWLAAVAFWIIHRLGGLTFTFLLRGVLLALTYGLLWRLMRRLGAGPQLAAGVTFLAALASSNNWSIRPQLLVYPLFVLTLWLLYSWLRGEQNRLWPLPFISLLWCNLHGSYVLFFILLGTALLLGAGDRKKLLLWSLASAVVMFINPRGPGLLFDTLDMLRSPSNQSFSTEWSPPVNLGWQMNLFFGWLLLLAPLAAWSPRKLSRLEWSWMLIFGWMALSGTRYGIWFLLLMALYTAGWLADWGRRFLDRPRPEGSAFLNISIGLLLLLLSLLLLPGLRERWWAAAPLPYEFRHHAGARRRMALHSSGAARPHALGLRLQQLPRIRPARASRLDRYPLLQLSRRALAAVPVAGSRRPRMACPPRRGGHQPRPARRGHRAAPDRRHAHQSRLVRTVRRCGCRAVHKVRSPAMKTYPGRLALQQRILPSYRVPFFDLLASACPQGLSVFAGEARPEESVTPGIPRIAHYTHAQNVHLFNGAFYLLYQRGLLEWLQDRDPDALIVEANPRYLSTPAAVRWMHARSRPVLGWGLGSPPISGPLAGMRAQRRLAFLRQFDGLLAYSQRGADEYTALGFPADRIFVAHNSVSPAPSTPPADRPVSTGQPSILFVGRLQAREAPRPAPARLRQRWISSRASWSWGMAPNAPCWKNWPRPSIPPPSSPARGTARNCAPISPPPICSSSPARAGLPCRRP